MEIKPWLTAIRRKTLSAPMKKLLDEKTFNVEDKILDYGCGHGKDVETLRQNNFNIKGYDKYIAPFNNNDLLNSKYKKIICNYVLNVIPSPDERIEAISSMLNCLEENGVAYLSVRSSKELEGMKNVDFLKYNDGIVTKRNTFQKYFSWEELLGFFNENFPEVILEEIPYQSKTIFIKISKKNDIIQ